MRIVLICGKWFFFQTARVSSVTNEGMSELWDKMKDFRNKMTQSGDLERMREKQHVKWMRNHIRDSMTALFNEHPTVKRLTPKLEFLVEKGVMTSGYAADIVLQEFSRSFTNRRSANDVIETTELERHIDKEIDGWHR